eukprot:1161901-Pelagomonas_calceolata.AAC.5
MPLHSEMHDYASALITATHPKMYACATTLIPKTPVSMHARKVPQVENQGDDTNHNKPLRCTI